VHESRIARTLRFEPGTIVVFDRGYNDYAWFATLDAEGVYFVTRMKDNTDYGVVERRPVPERGPVQRDEIVFLYKLARQAERDLFLRRIEVWDEEQQRTLVFLTNHRHFCRLYHRPDLPPALADRAVLQGAQAEPAHQNVVDLQNLFRPHIASQNGSCQRRQH
jgi:hypothetical protein